MCMVYPSGHGHIVATENLGICNSRGSHAVASQNTLMICDTVGWNSTIWNMASGHISGSRLPRGPATPTSVRIT